MAERGVGGKGKGGGEGWGGYIFLSYILDESGVDFGAV